MKKFLSLIIVMLSVCAIGLVGCKDIANTVNPDNTPEKVVSYLSTDSTVFSSTADVVDEVADSVVEISTETVTTGWGMQYIVSGAGSGVIVGKSEDKYYVITNNHVIEGATEITLRTRYGVSYEGKLLATDDSQDIAVVTVTTSDNLKIAVWGNSDDLRIGEDLIAIGNPLGNLGGTVTKGILSAKGRKIVIGNYAMTLLQTDTAINPGNSGGGLFNMRGELIGVVNAKTSDEEVEGICFAIPSVTAKTVYESLVEKGYLEGRATLSVEVSSGSISSGIGGSETVVYVTAVGNVSNDTFKLYDRIYSLNGQVISSVADFNYFLSSIKPDDTVTVKVYRGSITQGYFGNSITFSNQLTEFTVKAVQYGI